MPLLNFRLKPLPELVESWRWDGGNPVRYLTGWFWLSFGWYWISIPEGDVPTCHPDFNAAFSHPPDEDPHLDYQVARFLMDWQEIMPHVLEPLPEPFSHWVENGAWVEWDARMRVLQGQEDAPDWASFHEARAWWWHRFLDMGYLVAPPVIHAWRVGDTVTLVWDTRDKRVEGHLCWVETQGQLQMPVPQWLSEWTDFEARLESAMRERLHEVEALGLLSAEQIASLWEQHEKYFPGAPIPEKTDWGSVLAAVTTLESWSGLHLPH